MLIAPLQPKTSNDSLSSEEVLLSSSFVLAYLPAIFHIVSLSFRVARNRLFGKHPTPYHLRKIIASASSSTSAVVVRAKVRVGWENMHPVETMLEWLDFSKYIKVMKNAWQATQSAARVLATSTGRSFREVLGEAKGCSGKVLRAARIKLDSVALLLFRQLWRTLHNSSIAIFIYLDSSPQTRGHELFATSFEIWDMSGQFPFERRLFPLLSLPRDYLDATGKSLALLWLIWLSVGPDYDQVLRFCDSVVCIVTDMGTERLIARIPNFLEDFYSLILNINIKHPIPRQYMFTFAIQLPGWQHGWDIVLKRGFKTLPFFPGWLAGMRSVTNFLRTQLLKENLCSKLRQAGHCTISMMIASVSLPSIAEWRWGTLHRACQELSKIIATLRQYFDPMWFQNAKDPTTIKLASKTLSSSAWAWQFKFIMWFSDL